MKLAIVICATQKYTYAMSAQARRVQSCVSELSNLEKGYVILVGDDSEELKFIQKLYKDILPSEKEGQWEIIRISNPDLESDYKNYKEEAQLLIGQLRTSGFTLARKLNVDYCWSLDSDVLPPPNALRCMFTMLDFDNGYFDCSIVPYISQGGGGWVSLGYGSFKNPIAEDIDESEREIPEELKKEKEELDKELSLFQVENKLPDGDWIKKIEDYHKKVKACRPKGNVHTLNGIKWRRRGWETGVAVGKGSTIEVSWSGMGCNLLTKKALKHCHFDGYNGKGTEDLYINWFKWWPNNLKICSIPHCLCDHVIRRKYKVKDKEGNDTEEEKVKYVLCQAYHEFEGECIGHPRIRYRPFYSFELGEKYNPENDGVM